MKDLKKKIEDRIGTLNVKKDGSSTQNGQTWARREELKWVLNIINKNSK